MITESPRQAPSAAVPGSTPSTVFTKAFARAVLLITAIAGTLDVIAAHLYFWANSAKFSATLLKSIAVGALGRERAKQGGLEMMALGAFFHYFISFAFTQSFPAHPPRRSATEENRYAVGAAYAIFVSSVMDYVVLPLSALPWKPPS
jgi:hypothetical protein